MATSQGGPEVTVLNIGNVLMVCQDGFKITSDGLEVHGGVEVGQPQYDIRNETTLGELASI